ncbi:MAG: hypothetical protein HY656_00775 [Acidobacteria bacterium]|nr:hypothetical protein [Acidobacteriota bacterium]
MHLTTQREKGGALQIILAVLGAIVLVAALVVLAAVVIVKEYVKIEVQETGSEKKVAVHTPIGEFAIEKDRDAARKLKLPVYPGAEPDEDSVSVRLWGRVEEEEGGLSITAGTFRTSDPFDKVDAWYRQQLGPEFTRETGRIVGGQRKGNGEWVIRIEPGGDDVLYKREAEGRLRGVGLTRERGQVRIGLFEVVEARTQ